MKDIAVYRDYGKIDSKVIIDFAKSMDVIFPNSYIELLSQHNALTPLNSYASFVDIDGGEGLCGVSFFGFGYQKIEVYDEESLALFQNSLGPSAAIERSQPDEYISKHIIAIGCTGAGDYICFDYRKDPTSSEPEVVFMYHDLYIKDEQENPKMAISKIANNFEEFIDMLHE
ncbi:SMI1/KNR4 family protein [Sulfurospirillum multivorans]|uniref:SMI1/KNR4 family protein n=2 Tax=Sulfurospirillum multivorans TaxID=66821 RepID=A0AA86AM40_SULMK|nr:SMI1/KNR4 family protein [Sulfurospirillum multivorans]AHJ13325.1 SMI1/KNR4 family protein [Sulfurospirillum multivorans DSM 12446]QEH06815.1 SMI1/KNR4 family protein [Sulfurospirillum multivorans]